MMVHQSILTTKALQQPGKSQGMLSHEWAAIRRSCVNLMGSRKRSWDSYWVVNLTTILWEMMWESVIMLIEHDWAKQHENDSNWKGAIFQVIYNKNFSTVSELRTRLESSGFCFYSSINDFSCSIYTWTIKEPHLKTGLDITQSHHAHL